MCDCCKCTEEKLLETAINELSVSRLHTEYLLSVLEEIEELTDDRLILSIIDNAIERHNLDKLVHGRILFK